MPTLITQTELGRRLGKSPATIMRHVRRAGVEPFGVVLQHGREDLLVFELGNIEELRTKLGNNPDRNIVA